MCFNSKVIQLHTQECRRELCSCLWLSVTEYVHLFSPLNSEENYHFSIWYKYLACAHWSKMFKYLILSPIIVLPGKWNVTVRDNFPTSETAFIQSKGENIIKEQPAQKSCAWQPKTFFSVTLQILFPPEGMPYPTKKKKKIWKWAKNPKHSSDLRKGVVSKILLTVTMEKEPHTIWHQLK